MKPIFWIIIMLSFLSLTISSISFFNNIEGKTISDNQSINSDNGIKSTNSDIINESITTNEIVENQGIDSNIVENIINEKDVKIETNSEVTNESINNNVIEDITQKDIVDNGNIIVEEEIKFNELTPYDNTFIESGYKIRPLLGFIPASSINKDFYNFFKNIKTEKLYSNLKIKDIKIIYDIKSQINYNYFIINTDSENIKLICYKEICLGEDIAHIDTIVGNKDRVLSAELDALRIEKGEKNNIYIQKCKNNECKVFRYIIELDDNTYKKVKDSFYFDVKTDDDMEMFNRLFKY